MSASVPTILARAPRADARRPPRGRGLAAIAWAIAAVAVSLAGGVHLAATTPPELLQAILGP